MLERNMVMFKRKNPMYNRRQYKNYYLKLRKLKKKYLSISKNFQVIERIGNEERVKGKIL